MCYLVLVLACTPLLTSIGIDNMLKQANFLKTGASILKVTSLDVASKSEHSSTTVVPVSMIFVVLDFFSSSGVPFDEL